MKKKTIVLIYLARSPLEINPAIYYLKEHARHTFPDVDFETLVYSENETVRDIVMDIRSKEPVMVGFSTYIWNIQKTLQIARIFRLRNPDTPMVLGGPEASHNAYDILSKSHGIDVIAVGEGEQIFTELVAHYLKKKEDLSAIKGIYFRKKSRIVKTNPSPVLDLSLIKSPFLGGCIPEILGKIVTYETSRGCPFKCAYCSYNSGSYARMRYFPQDQVIREISSLLSKKPKKINVVDDNFNINEIRAMKLLEQIRVHIGKTNVTLFLRADVWRMGHEIVRLLAHKHIFCTVGVQSLNLSTLQSAERTHQRDNLEYNLRLLKKHGVQFILQFIVGLPGDKYQDVKDMIDWSFRYAPYQIHLQILRINPGTAYAIRAPEFGIRYRKKPPHTIYKTRTMGAMSLKKAELLASCFESIYNNGQLQKKLFHTYQRTAFPISKIIEMTIGMINRQH